MRPLRQTAFSLVELLVVVTILALLAALLFPVFVEARARSLRTSCAGRLRQIGHAFALYESDHDGDLPDRSPRAGLPGGFSSPLSPYAPESVHVCPLGPYGYRYRLFLLGESGLPADLWPGLGSRAPAASREPSPSAVLAVCDAHLLEGFFVKGTMPYLAMLPSGRRGRQILLRADGSADDVDARSVRTMAPGIRDGQPVWETYGAGEALPDGRMLMDLFPGEPGPYGLPTVPGGRP